jgi:hypothetical protein
MLTMAAIGGVYAWRTMEYRRKNDYRTQKKLDPVLQKAAAAPILGFLPAQCNVLAAINVAELMKNPTSRRLLDPPRPAPLDLVLDRLERWTGLTVNDLDHIVLGAEIKSELPPLFVVVQTRHPYAPGKVAAALAPAQPTRHRQKLLVRFPLKPTGEGLLWCHSERVLVLVLCLDAAMTDDLDAIAPRPRPGTEGFAASLRAVLDQRLPSTSALWLAGHFEEPSALGDLLALTGKKSAELDLLLRVKTFSVAVQPHDGLTLTGHFFTGDVKTAQRLRTLLEARRWPDAQSYKVEAPPPEVAEPDAQWVTLQARGDVASGWMAWRGK